MGINPDDLIITFDNTGDEYKATYEFLQAQQIHWDIRFNWLEYDFTEGFSELILKRPPTYEALAQCVKDGTGFTGMYHTDLLNTIKWSDEWKDKTTRPKSIKKSLKEGQTQLFGNSYSDYIETIRDFSRCMKDFYSMIDKSRGDLSDRFREVSYTTANRTGLPFLKNLLYKNAIRYVKDLPYIVPNAAQRFSTGDLKVRVSDNYLESLGLKRQEYIKVLGIRYDEPARYWGNLTSDGITWMPLYEQKIVSGDVKTFWDSMPFQLSIRDKKWLGNCVDCYLKTFERRVKACQESPEHFERRMVIEQAAGDFMKRGEPAERILEVASQIEVEDKESGISCMCG